VTVTSIIDIEVRDEQILKFVELMKQQREMVKQLPSEWRAAGGAIADVTGEMDELVALYRERTELSKKNREEDRKEAAEKAEARETAAAKSKEERNLAQEEREAERAARKEQAEADQEAADIARQRQRAEEDHEKKIQAFWEKKSQQARAFARDFGLGLIGMGAGLFGLEKLADSVSSNRVAAQQLGISTGEKAAFDLNFGNRFGLDSSFVSKVQDVQADLNQRWQFAGLHLQNEAATEDHATLSADVIKRAKVLWDEAGPQGHNKSWMLGSGLSGFMDFAQWQGIGAHSTAEVNEAADNYARDARRLSVPDADQKSWQDFSIQIQRAGQQIENVFIKGLVPLLGPLQHLSEDVVHMVEAFLGSQALKDGIAKLSEGIKWLADWMASPAFETDLQGFLKAIEEASQGIKGKRKLTPTFRLGFDLARLRVVVGEAVWDGWDRELV
jgi:hypothetical protein